MLRQRRELWQKTPDLRELALALERPPAGYRDREAADFDRLFRRP
jgi:hypothetical protein